MRILITDTGQQFIKSIEEENQTKIKIKEKKVTKDSEENNSQFKNSFRKKRSNKIDLEDSHKVKIQEKEKTIKLTEESAAGIKLLLPELSSRSPLNFPNKSLFKQNSIMSNKSTPFKFHSTAKISEIPELDLDSNELKILKTNESINRIDCINIRQTKINFSKGMKERYNNFAEKPSHRRVLTEVQSGASSPIISRLPTKLTKYPPDWGLTSASPLNLTAAAVAENPILTQAQSFSLKEIISSDKIKNLKIKVKENIIAINQTKKFSLDNIRTNYQEKSPEKIIDENLNKKIYVDNVDLIKYIGNKEKISDILLKYVNYANDKKLIYLDKVCKKKIQLNESEKMIKSIINSKIKLKNKNNLKVYRDKLIEMEEESSKIHDFNEKYSILCNKYLGIRNNLYNDKLNEMKNNFWRVYNVDKINKEIGSKSMTKSVIKGKTNRSISLL